MRISICKSVSRRDILSRTVAVTASAAGWAVSPARAQQEPSEAQKITHADAKYQSTQNSQQRCEICLQFEPPDHCKIVQSPITPHGWCQYFAARENAH
jgi:hypothetical protein